MVSEWSDTKDSLNYMHHVLYPNLRDVEDVVEIVYGNCVASALRNVFVYLFTNDYEAVDDIEKHHISLLKNSWKIIEKRGWLNV